MAPTAPTEGVKRGRGRPRKDPSEKKVKTPSGRPRGRPKGSGGVKKNTAASATTTPTATRSGRPVGRPRKDPSERKTPVSKPTGRGRGRPRKSETVAAADADAPTSAKATPTPTKKVGPKGSRTSGAGGDDNAASGHKEDAAFETDDQEIDSTGQDASE